MFRKLFDYESMSDKQLSDRMAVIAENEKSRVFVASKLAKWFSVDLTISIFGHPIVEWHFPPQNERN